MTIPDHLRPHVESILRAYFLEGVSRSYTVSGTGKSITQANCDRAAALSNRSKPCPTCKGEKTFPWQRVGKKGPYVVADPCPECKGLGEVGKTFSMKLADGSCSRCHGSGTYHAKAQLVTPLGKGQVVLRNSAYSCFAKLRKVYVEVESEVDGKAFTETVSRLVDNPEHDPEHELGLCVQCRGRGYITYAAIPGPESEPGGWSPADEPDTPVGIVLARMRSHDQQISTAALELAYGEMGSLVGRKHGEPCDLALWAMTRPGKRLVELLIKRLELKPGEQPHKALARARGYSDPETAILVAGAQTGAIAAIELGMKRFWEADAATGGKVEQMAKRMERRAA